MNGRFVFFAIAVHLSACSSGLADLQPKALQTAPPTDVDIARGRALVDQMFEAHGGLKRWRSFNFVVAQVSDEWFNSLFWTLVTPYTENPEHVAVAAYTQEFPNGRVEFTGGRNAGLVWAARGEEVWRKRPGREAESQTVSEDGVLSTLVHNFMVWPMFPFLLSSVDQVVHIGADEYQGQRYEKVLVSWGELAPQPGADQWILWINAESKYLERVWFTVRLLGDSSVAGFNLKGFKDVQGLQIATMCEGVLGLDENPIHTYVLSHLEFSNRASTDLTKNVIDR